MLKPEERFEALDGLRGFAALYVVVFHRLCFYPTSSQFSNRLLGYGYGSVQLFFCLSGFLLAHTLKDAPRSAKSQLWDFWQNRFWRIFPLWSIIILLHQFLFGMAGDVLLANLTFIFGFFSYDSRWLPIVSAWSLFVEVLFYLLYPLLVLKLKKISHWTMFFILALCIRLAWQRFASSFGVPTSEYFISRHPLYNGSLFAAGICLRLFYDRTDLKSWLLEPSGGRTSLALASLAVFLFFLPAWRASFPPEVGCVAVIAVALKRGTFINVISKGRAIRWIGVRCYAVYIGQMTLMKLMGPYKLLFSQWTGFHELALELAWLPIFISVLLLFSAMSWRLVEFPCIRWGRSLSSSH